MSVEKNIINVLFSWGGRISARQFFLGLLVNLAVFVVGIRILRLCINKSLFILATFIFVIIILFSTYTTKNLTIKRFHDLGQDWKSAVFMRTKGQLNIIFLAKSGEPKENRYGKPIIYKRKIQVHMWIFIILVAAICITGFVMLFLQLINNPEIWSNYFDWLFGSFGRLSVQ